jgi:hypothetical protein
MNIIETIIGFIQFHFQYFPVAIGILLILYLVLFTMYNRFGMKWVKTWFGPPFIVLDVINNWTSFIVLCLDWAHEPTVTARLNRYIDLYEGTTHKSPLGWWRYGVAVFFRPILNWADPGHIKRKIK